MGGERRPSANVPEGVKVDALAFSLVAELGDKTQLAVIIVASGLFLAVGIF